MTMWPARNTGVLFGGVTDKDTGEETLESVFWNDLCVRLVLYYMTLLNYALRNGYHWAGKGKWVSMTLRRPKKKGSGGKKSKIAVATPVQALGDEEDQDSDDANDVCQVLARLHYCI
jgi:hypothetical protein